MACYIVSAVINFELSWILVGITSVWAGIDAKKIGFKRYKSGCSPISLFCVCYLVWIVAFPVYLWVRTKITNGTAVLKNESLENLGLVGRFFRRLSPVSELVVQWVAILIVVLKIGVLIFCAEECWRGQRVWESYRHELEAKGESFDWDALIPPSVPDSQNIFSAPMMSTWFVRGKIAFTEDLSQRYNYTNATAATVVADVAIVPPGPHPDAGQGTILLQLDDPASPKLAMNAIQSVIGPFTFGAQGMSVFVAKPPDLNKTKPPRFVFESNKQQTIWDLRLFFNNKNTREGSFTVKAVGTNSFQVLASFTMASDYLRWSDQQQTIFDRTSEALKRPYARMDGDYSYPLTIPVQNSTAIGAVARTLAGRAQSHLLLGQPEKALSDLTLLHGLRHLVEGAPTGKPTTLLSAMVDASVTLLYVNTVADGFRMHAWQEPQLALLQKQLAQINLSPIVYEAFRDQQTSDFRLWQIVMAE